MSNPNIVNLNNLDSRYISPTQVDAKIAAQTYWNVRSASNGSITASVGDYVLLDTSTGTITVTAPSPTNGRMFGVKWVAGSFTPTITGPFSPTPSFPLLGIAYEYIADGTSWHHASRPALSQLPDYPAVTDARYVQIGSAGFAADVQIFSATGAYTWTKPASVHTVSVLLVAGGSGGGSGRRGAAGTVRTGGGTGYAAIRTRVQFIAAQLPATVTGSVGYGGYGGAAVTTDDTNGIAGGGAGATTFGSFARAGTGGNGGGPGSTTTSGVGVYGGNGGGTDAGGAPAASSSTGGVGAAGGTGSGDGNGGAGAGGGITSSNVASNGGAGGVVNSGSLTPGAGGIVDGSLPDANDSAWVLGRAIAGSGGGAASITQAAQAGYSPPANSGGAGGGGGASLNGFNSGKGGNGASGVAIITSW